MSYGYVPPSIRFGGYHYGPANRVDTSWGGKPLVHHRRYAQEIVDQRAQDGRDWNGALAGALCNALLERHDGGYHGWDRGDYCIRPYCWCERDDCAWCAGLCPYFIDKPSQLSFVWYKHPHRGFEASREYVATDVLAIATRLAVNLDDA